MIRFGKSPPPAHNKNKKADNLDLLTLVDNCTQIFKDDRIALRNLVKEGNPQLMGLLNTFKKSNNIKDLQTELRKFLKRKTESKENASVDKQYISEKLQTTQSPQTMRNFRSVLDRDVTMGSGSQKKSCPDLWKDQQQAKTINLIRPKEEVSGIMLTERESVKMSVVQELHQSQVSQTQVQSAVQSQLQSQYQSNQSDQIQRQISQTTQVNEEISDTEIDTSQESMLEIVEVNQSVATSLKCESIKCESIKCQSIKCQSSKCPTIQSEQPPQQPIKVVDQRDYYYHYTDCQMLALPTYKQLFTHWPSLLSNLQDHEYIASNKIPIQLNCTPEYLFNLLFPDSSNLKVNYYRFTHVLNNVVAGDLDQLFRQFDQDYDDWINYRDTGLLLEGVCTQVESPINCVKVIFNTIKKQSNMPNTLSYAEVDEFLTANQQDFTKYLFQEIDTYQKGFLTYWDLYMHRDIYLMQKLCELVQSLQ